MAFTDINFSHFLFRTTPAGWHPYIRLARLDRPIGVWLLLFPALWGLALPSYGLFNMDAAVWRMAGFFVIGAFLMRAAGCVINDLWDRELDKGVERTALRPLAAGEISVFRALIFLFVLLLAAFLILLTFNRLAILLGGLIILPIILYPAMKRITWWPQLFLGITFNWGILIGWAAVTETLSLTAFILYLGGVFWTIAFDTIYAHQDKEDDARIGIKSTALLFGEKSKHWVIGFYTGAVLFILSAKLWYFPTPFILFSVAILGVFVYRLLKKWNPADAQSSLDTFKRGGHLGWIVLILLSV